MKIIGIILIVAGLFMTVFTGFTLVTKKKVADIGPIEINKEESEPIGWTPIVGIVVFVSGIGLVAFDRKNK